MFKLEWGHRTTFKHVLKAEGGAPHIFKLTWVGAAGRVESVMTKTYTTSWLHLASWNLLDSQLSLESEMESSVAKSAHKEQASI